MEVVTRRSKVLFEDERVRVKEVVTPPGDKMPMHSHPDYVIYAKSACKTLLRNPDGSTELVDYEAGKVMSRKAETHEVENIGGTECDVVLVELK